MKETTKEIVMQESTAADLAVIPESSFQEPKTTMEEVIQSRLAKVGGLFLPRGVETYCKTP